MAKKYPTSAACQRRYDHSRGRASTANGTSQMTYCGDHTLLVSRKAASVRKKTCGSRGRRGAARMISATNRHATTKTARARTLSVSILSVPTKGQCSVSKKYQMDPQSAVLVALSW